MDAYDVWADLEAAMEEQRSALAFLKEARTVQGRLAASTVLTRLERRPRTAEELREFLRQLREEVALARPVLRALPGGCEATPSRAQAAPSTSEDPWLRLRRLHSELCELEIDDDDEPADAQLPRDARAAGRRHLEIVKDSAS